MKNYKQPTAKVQRRMEEKMKGKAIQKARDNKQARNQFFASNFSLQKD